MRSWWVIGSCDWCLVTWLVFRAETFLGLWEELNLHPPLPSVGKGYCAWSFWGSFEGHGGKRNKEVGRLVSQWQRQRTLTFDCKGIICNSRVKVCLEHKLVRVSVCRCVARLGHDLLCLWSHKNGHAWVDSKWVNSKMSQHICPCQAYNVLDNLTTLPTDHQIPGLH